MTSQADAVSQEGGLISSLNETRRPARWIGASIVSVSLVAGLVTYVVLTGLTPIEPTESVVNAFLIGNSCLVIALLIATGREFLGLLQARQRGRAAARFHIRIVALFSLIAVLPAVLVAIFAFITLDRGLDRWFQDRTREIVDNSISVANAYLREHAGILRGDLIAMGTDIDRVKAVYDFDPRRFDTFFQTQARLRQMPAAYLLSKDGKIITRTGTNPTEVPYSAPLSSLRRAADGDPILIAPGRTNYVGAVLKLTNYDETYLYVTRAVDPRVVEYLQLAQESADEYTEMSSSRAGVQVAFALVYTGLSLVLLLSAVWIGIGFANQIVAPVRRLISAADEVAKGNLQVHVPTRKREGDLGHLGATFNTMIRELNNQRNELVSANGLLDERRRVTEAVLAGVTAGVLGIDPRRSVTLVNGSAVDLLETKADHILGQPLSQISPTLDAVVQRAYASQRGLYEEQVVLAFAPDPKTLIVRVAIERDVTAADRNPKDAAAPFTEVAGHEGAVLTLDDITDLVAAQRSAAWADVARRIAHEIKNPLTPIQLSAERLQRRFGRNIDDDSGVFAQCVETIVRQVGDIGRMVDEFSAFARMPKPQFVDADVRETIKEAVFLQSVSHPNIKFDIDMPESSVVLKHDARLLTQVFTNLVKNAAEAIDANKERQEGGRIVVAVEPTVSRVDLFVVDNGIGFPDKARSTLLEPYMTTREKGTGLGLAIVRKIVEDHGGFIELDDAASYDPTMGHGALVRLSFALGVYNAGTADIGGSEATPLDHLQLSPGALLQNRFPLKAPDMEGADRGSTPDIKPIKNQL